jgi:tungstate transport system substrate-binding protein
MAVSKKSMLTTKSIKLLCCCLLLLSAVPALGIEHLRLATTTSTENSGLLAVLLPPFEEINNCHVDVLSVGTGKALKLGESGDVDVVLVHARSKEDRFVANGYGIDRRDVMYNDFVILGPIDDPVGIAGSKDIATALSRIVDAREFFVSRGDDSGTHIRERQLWKDIGVIPDGDWYLEVGRSMGEVITMTNERRGYTLSDRGTFLAYQAKTDLIVAAEGIPALLNPYGVIQVNPARHPHVKAELAKRFLEYLVSQSARKLITSFRVNGEQLFFIDI